MNSKEKIVDVLEFNYDMIIDFSQDVYSDLEQLESKIRSSQGFQSRPLEHLVCSPLPQNHLVKPTQRRSGSSTH